MAIFRSIHTNFWKDAFIMDLTPEERYIYIYLMSNPRTTQCGIFELPKRAVEMETGYTRETVDKLIKRFEDYGKILYCEETKEIMIINWMKYNFINSKNTISCINKELKNVKNKDFVKRLYNICQEKGYAVEGIFQDITLEEKNKGLASGYEGACKELGEKEKQKEIKKEKENQKEIDSNSGASQDRYAQSSESMVLFEFSKNIKQATIRDIEKIMDWKKHFEEEVIIQAILEAAKYNAKSSSYVESVLKNWSSLGIYSIEKLREYRKRGTRKKEANTVNSDAYRYVD